MKVGSTVKSILICLLAITAFYMLFISMSALITGTGSSAKGLSTDKLAEISGNGKSDYSDNRNSICPVFIGCKSDNESKGVFTGEELISAMYSALGKEFEGLLSSDAKCQKLEGEDAKALWASCFEAEKYVYIDYGCELPAAAVALEASVSDSGRIGGDPGIIEKLFIIYSDKIYAVSCSSDGDIYRYDAKNGFSVEPKIFAYTDRAEPMRFVLTAESANARSDIYGSVVTDAVVLSCPVMLGEKSVNEHFLSPLFELLGYNSSNLNSYYYGVDDTVVYIGQSGNTVVYCKSGQIVYTSENGGLDLRNTVWESEISGFSDYFECAEAIRRTLSSVAENNGSLYLSGVTYSENDELTFTYEYRYNGIRIIGAGAPLSITMSAGKLIKLTFLPLGISPSGARISSLPQSLLSTGTEAHFAYYTDGEILGEYNAQWRYEKEDTE